MDGHSTVLRPWSSRYQLRQPPLFQTVGASRRCRSAFQASCTSRRGSNAPRPRVARTSPARYRACASANSSTEVWPWPVFGPISTTRFGKPATVTPRWACIPVPAQCSARVRPSAPTTRSATGWSVTWKPVPQTSTSAGCSVRVPSAARETTACGSTSTTRSVTTVVAGAVSAGYQSLLSSTRLQPEAEGRRQRRAQPAVGHLAGQVGPGQHLRRRMIRVRPLNPSTQLSRNRSVRRRTSRCSAGHPPVEHLLEPR